MPILVLIGALACGAPPTKTRPSAEKKLRHPSVTHAVTSGDGLWVRSPKRSFGTRKTVTLFRRAVQKVRKRFPGTAELMVGDLSYRGGGRMRPHRSHRDGRDIDAAYWLRDGRPRRWFARARYKTLDVARTWALFETLIATGEVEYIFVSYRLQKALYRHARKQGASKRWLRGIFQWPRHWRRKAGIIRFERGHRDHFHVRFKKD